MRSMTGYGRGQAVKNGSKYSVELNSVNRKQTDIVVNLPRELAELEPRVRDVINAEVARGRMNVVIAWHRSDTAAVSTAVIDRALAKTYLKAIRDLRAELGIGGEIEIETIVRAPGVLRTPEEQLQPEESWPLIEKALRGALSDLMKMREREGKHLAKDLEKRLGTLKTTVAKIRKLQPRAVERYRKVLHERIQSAGLHIPLDDERLAKEVLIFADKSDVTEELTRLESHFDQMGAHLKKNEPVGRTLEFLCQEIGRECNTLGAKANDAEISQLVVTCKAELEKIREQLSNIE